MAYLIIVVTIFILYISKVKGFVKLTESEEAMLDGYTGFIKVDLKSDTADVDSLLDDTDPSLVVLGDLNGKSSLDVNGSDMEDIDINKYL